MDNGQEQSELPTSWSLVQLPEIAEINPTLDKRDIDDNLLVSFVPMPAVEAETGHIDVSAQREFSEVKKGYTGFREGDVLFAKITPCMENGKMAVVPALQNDIGFGSTEFHVLRVYGDISPQYLYYFVSSKQFRMIAERNMTGAVGQRRVPTSYINESKIPLPPASEQQRIVAKIEELFSELDKGVENLRTAQQQLKVYRQVLLKHAFEGKLTAGWRAQNPDKLESAEALLAHIQQEREGRDQQLLQDWQAAQKEWEENGKVGSKPSKPKVQKALPPLTVEELVELPKLPMGWAWVKYGDLCSLVRNGISAKPDGDSGTPIFRISAVRPLFFDMTDIRYIDNSTGGFDSYYLQRGDLVFTRYNGSRHYVGVCAEYRSDGKYLFPDKLVQTRVFSKKISTSYLEKTLNSGASRQFIESKIRTTAGQSGVSGDDIKSTPVPVCSPFEQCLIIKEIESKLSEVDQLQQTITHSLQQADALRQSILKKAFSGQLVPQDPNDEPASVLLERIRAERAAQPKARGRKAKASV
ncbi:restriction endonuclease subunit S [Pseudomonas stutzeri]|uniref:restriction endonuclease subunit S n=1 Tax=Stutzerimonas stutzeri TaxID=316 RepID=UPI0021092DF3|nr:restriction endonuclease subunit S [Stutzerimonas stutzeri]